MDVRAVLAEFAPPLVMPLFVALVALALAAAAVSRFPAATRALVLFALLVLTAFALPVTANALLGSLERRYPPVALDALPRADAVVFLAGATEPPLGPRRQPELGARGDRLLLAARLLRAGKAPRVYLSGGTARGGRDFDAEILREWGVDGTRIVSARKGHDTESSAAAIAPLLAEARVESILLVTSAYHMPRAMRLFGELVDSVVPVTANHFIRDDRGPRVSDWVPNALSLSGSTLALHEYLGMLELALRR